MTDLISLNDLKVFENVPRVLDLKLAEALEFDRLRKIRDLVKRHRSELERYGEVCTKLGQTSEKGGRPEREYWLNEEQACLLAMFSRTTRAADVREQIIRAFVTWRMLHRPAAADFDIDRQMDEDAEAWQAKLTLLRECRLIFGRAAAKSLWYRLKMPGADGCVVADDANTALDRQLGEFLIARTTSSPGGRVQARVLYEAFAVFCRENGGVGVVSEKAFSLAMTRRGFERSHSRMVWWLGLALRPMMVVAKLPA